MPGRQIRSAQLFAKEPVCSNLAQPKELDIYYRPDTKQSGLKLWIGELGCNVQRFPQCLVGRLIDSGRCKRLREDSEKTRPVSANLCRKVRKPAPCCFGCFLEAASPDRGGGQLGKASPDHRAIIEVYVNFEHFTQMGYRRVPLIKPSLGHRQARQQVSPLSWVNRALMRQGRLEIPPRFLKCCSFKCALACQRQPTDQFLSVNERSCLEKMISDLPGALFNGIRIEPLDRLGDARVHSLSAGG